LVIRSLALQQLFFGNGVSYIHTMNRLSYDGTMRLLLLGMFLPLLCLSATAHADAALLLEEPFGHFGAFTATGHAAVYLTRICAASPTVLRRCERGESGAVISRYNGVAGYDWIAIPIIPYLYAVESTDDVPLYSDAKIVAFLRNQYRKKHLEAVAPDGENGETPGGNWDQLVGSAYDRTIYGFEIETTEEQDDAFIREYNSRPNRARFKLLTHNCADFARQVINSYYPRTAHRNLLADAGITTPKQIAKLLVKFSVKHPELQSSSFVIPQVPGSIARSTPVHGVVESVLKSKKYLLPLAALHPIVTGVLAVAYIGSGRFDPTRRAMIMDSAGELETPLPSVQRRAYRRQLEQLLVRMNPQIKTWQNERAWARLEAGASLQLDVSGMPYLQMRVGAELISVGISRDNILESDVAPQLAQKLLVARLDEELRSGATPKASESDVVRDWELLQQVLPAESK